uniref:Bm1359, isoform b n=1 Tax=Brugia malayi TaxID=6279 RepID=A0A1I9G2P8_BRUMA|nr:Bm1359, isoform b [Brugia malayi]
MDGLIFLFAYVVAIKEVVSYIYSNSVNYYPSVSIERYWLLFIDFIYFACGSLSRYKSFNPMK